MYFDCEWNRNRYNVFVVHIHQEAEGKNMRIISIWATLAMYKSNDFKNTLKNDLQK